MTGYWMAVASAEHVRRGRSEGFMQVCHGKAAPLRRIKPDDGIIYNSPTVTFGGRDRLQAFTAIGTVQGAQTYQIDMGGGFRPYRRDVVWAEAVPPRRAQTTATTATAPGRTRRMVVTA